MLDFQVSHSTPAKRQPTRDKLIPNPAASLREQLREVMRFRHNSPRTETTYWQWIERFLRFHKRTGFTGAAAWRHPREMGGPEVTAFLSHLASELHVSASTQNQALNALVFLYGEVLHQPLGEMDAFARAKRPARLPEVLSREETRRFSEGLVLGPREVGAPSATASSGPVLGDAGSSSFLHAG